MSIIFHNRPIISGGARPVFLPGHIQVIDPFSQVSPALDFRPIFARFGSFSCVLGRFWHRCLVNVHHTSLYCGRPADPLNYVLHLIRMECWWNFVSKLMILQLEEGLGLRSAPLFWKWGDKVRERSEQKNWPPHFKPTWGTLLAELFYIFCIERQWKNGKSAGSKMKQIANAMFSLLVWIKHYFMTKGWK